MIINTMVHRSIAEALIMLISTQMFSLILSFFLWCSEGGILQNPGAQVPFSCAFITGTIFCVSIASLLLFEPTCAYARWAVMRQVLFGAPWASVILSAVKLTIDMLHSDVSIILQKLTQKTYLRAIFVVKSRWAHFNVKLHFYITLSHFN